MLYSDYGGYLQHSLQAVKVADEIKDCRFQSESYYRLGIGFDYLKNSESALDWLYKAYFLSRNCSGSDTTHMRAARYLGAMYYGSQQGDSCIHYLQESAILML